MSTQTTTIQIRKETRQLLQENAKKSQTYDDFITELVVKQDVCKKCGGKIEDE